MSEPGAPSVRAPRRTANPSFNRDDKGYTGHVQDEATGLTYMQARFYDPVMGRFLSPFAGPSIHWIDGCPGSPVGFAEGGVGYFNRYAYVHNDPVNHTDPTGEQAFPRDDGSKTIIVFPQKTADHVDKRHSPNSVGPQNKFRGELGKDKGQMMAIAGIESAVASDSVIDEGVSGTVYEGRITGALGSIGTAGEDSVRVVTKDMTRLVDPQMLADVAQELATPEVVGMIAALEAANPDVEADINVEVVITQHPIHERDRKSR